MPYKYSNTEMEIFKFFWFLFPLLQPGLESTVDSSIILSCYVNFHGGLNEQMVLTYFNDGDKELVTLFDRTISFWISCVYFYTIFIAFFF